MEYVLDILRALPKDFNALTFNGIAFHNRHVTMQEAFHTIKSMAKSKRPDPDGLNTEFYLGIITFLVSKEVWFWSV